MLKSDPKKPVEGQAAVEKLSRRYHSVAKRMHQTDGDELLEMYLTSMTSSFDPHTSYMSPSNLDNFEIMMRLELEGIGAALKAEDGYTVVDKIIPGGPAEKEGHLKVEDRIVGVGQGLDGAMEDVVDMKLTDVVHLIRGAKRTVVRLEVMSGAAGGRKTIQITRAKVELKDSEAQSAILPVGQKPGGQPYQIGVIDLPSFYMDMGAAKLNMPDYRSTTRDVRKILEQFNARGVDAVILDLRRNGGGSLQEAINLTGLFTGEGPVVQVKHADGRVEPYDDTQPGPLWRGPLVVLISKFSASASEILAGAVQDYQRGIIVGDHSTHGKGTVQSLMDVGQQLIRFSPPHWGALKITMQQFYRPNGDSTQKRGVLSDVELPSLTTHLDVAEADLDYPVEFDQVRPVEYRKYGLVSKPLVDSLAALSLQRVNASADFQKRLKDIARYKAQKDRKYVTLNEKKFLEERAEMNADKEEEKQLEDISNPGGDGIKRTYYLNEALAIAADYTRMLSAPPVQVNVQSRAETR
jgi:carboxyl-terminal processing protease